LRIVAIDSAGHAGAGESEGGFFVIDSADLGTTAYGYDALNQLIASIYAPNQLEHYTYDPALNRSSVSGTGAPQGDGDGDGIPDVWEANHGLDPNDPADGSIDDDGDGMSNYAEYVACTDIFSSSSLLKITAVSVDGSGTHLTFLSMQEKLTW
jgi:YD repeat-containing protein